MRPPHRPPRFARFLISAGLPALLAAFHLAVLLLFLNPGVALSWPGVVGGTLRFSLLLVPLLLGLHAALPALRRLATSSRLLPWALTAVCGLAALGAGVNASRFAFYLPAGVNDRLLRAAIWLSVVTIAGFYTALLHTLHGRRYGSRSRWLFVLLVGASVLIVLERRESFRPPVFDPPKIAELRVDQRPQVVLVALPGASLDLILPLAERGSLPFLASLLHGGSTGRLAGIPPERGATAWATLATGKLPFRHGVLDAATWSAPFLGAGAEIRLLPAGLEGPARAVLSGSRRPADARTLLAMPLWSALGRAGFSVATVDVPLTSGGGGDVRWRLEDRFFSGSARPEEVDATFVRRFAVAPEDLSQDATVGLRDSPELLGALAGDTWRRDVAVRLLEEWPDLDVMFVRLPGLEVAGRRTFGGFAAVQFEGSRGRRERAAAARLTAYAGEVDRLLATLWSASWRAERLLVVVSPYGLSAPSGWRRLWGELGKGSTLEGRTGEGEDGCLLVFGDGVRSGVEARGGRILDLAPTLYYALGLPVPRDLDGRVLTEFFEPAFLAGHPLTFVPSFETLPPRRP